MCNLSATTTTTTTRIGKQEQELENWKATTTTSTIGKMFMCDDSNSETESVSQDESEKVNHP